MYENPTSFLKRIIKYSFSSNVKKIHITHKYTTLLKITDACNPAENKGNLFKSA